MSIRKIAPPNVVIGASITGRVALVAGITLLVALGGCTLEPTYHRPDVPVAQQWPDGLASSDTVVTANGTSPGPTAADVGWRDFFTDPQLQKLIELALEHNPDARIAALNIAAARAQYRIQRADLFPTVGGLTAIEEADRYPPGVFNPGSGVGTSSPSGGVTRYYNVGIGFTSYEIDFFGRIRSLTHAKLEQYLGYVETRRAAQISLVAEVANAYFVVMEDQYLETATRILLKSLEDSSALTRLSYEHGVASEIDWHQAQAAVETERASLAQFVGQTAQDHNALVQLVGAPLPDDVPKVPPFDADHLSEHLLDGLGFDEQKALSSLSPGLPSEVLVRRPDIIAAEHDLVAANANIGAARAAFFPSITLTTSYGTASDKLSGLFQHGSTTWTFSPQINLPIFAFETGFATLKLDEVEKNVYIVQYQQAIQTAFREVADALAAGSMLDGQITANQALVENTGASYQLEQLRFQNGIDSDLSVLSAQRTWYNTAEQYLGLKISRLQNLVTLYKTLGGGWIEHTTPPIEATADDKPAPAIQPQPQSP